MKTITEIMNWRYATQKFDTNKKVNDEDIQALLDAARLSPSWYGLQPWKFILVENPELRARLAEVSYNNKSKIIEAPRFVVFASKTNFSEHDVDAHIANTARIQGKQPQDLQGLRDAIVNGFLASHKATINEWAANQTHIAVGVFVASAAVTGIDAGPMGGFIPEEYDKILGLTEQGLHAQVICAVGYRDESDEALKRPKSRFPFEDVVIKV